MAYRGTFSRKDRDFNIEINFRINYLKNNKTRLAITPDAKDRLALVEDLLNNPSRGWVKIYNKYLNPDERTVTIKNMKNNLRKEISELLFLIYKDIPKSALTDEDATSLNIKIHKNGKKHIALVKYSPIGTIDKVSHSLITIRIQDPEHPDSTAMPYGHHANLIVGFKLTPDGPIIWDIDNFYEPHDKLFSVHFKLEDKGKTVYFLLRYVSSKGKAGNWSNLLSGIVI